MPLRNKSVVRVAIWASIALAVFLNGATRTSASAYSIPPFAKLEVHVPNTGLTADSNLLCMVRIDSAPASRAICYTSFAPSPPPSLPIAHLMRAYHQLASGEFNSATGMLTLHVQPCFSWLNSFAIKADLVIQLSKSGGVASGTDYVWADTAPAFDCAVTPQTGSLTLTPLTLNTDTDLDGCTDWQELGADQRLGGLRDPFNPWDYFDPNHNRSVRGDDILFVVRHFGQQYLASPPAAPNTPNPRYDANADRSNVGPNQWNLGPPNGVVSGQDILNIVKQYRHDCP